MLTRILLLLCCTALLGSASARFATLNPRVELIRERRMALVEMRRFLRTGHTREEWPDYAMNTLGIDPSITGRPNAVNGAFPALGASRRARPGIAVPATASSFKTLQMTRSSQYIQSHPRKLAAIMAMERAAVAKLIGDERHVDILDHRVVGGRANPTDRVAHQKVLRDAQKLQKLAAAFPNVAHVEGEDEELAKYFGTPTTGADAGDYDELEDNSAKTKGKKATSADADATGDSDMDAAESSDGKLVDYVDDEAMEAVSVHRASSALEHEPLSDAQIEALEENVKEIVKKGAKNVVKVSPADLDWTAGTHSALKACHNIVHHYGWCVLEFPARLSLSIGNIVVKQSNVVIYVPPTTTLSAAQPDAFKTHSDHLGEVEAQGLITVIGVMNVSIVGGGVLDGGRLAQWSGHFEVHPPHIVDVLAASDFTMSRMQLRNPPRGAVRILTSMRVRLHELHVFSDEMKQVDDPKQPESNAAAVSHRQLIPYGLLFQNVSNVHISNSLIETRASGLLGTGYDEPNGGSVDIGISGCQFKGVGARAQGACVALYDGVLEVQSHNVVCEHYALAVLVSESGSVDHTWRSVSAVTHEAWKVNDVERLIDIHMSLPTHKGAVFLRDFGVTHVLVGGVIQCVVDECTEGAVALQRIEFETAARIHCDKIFVFLPDASESNLIVDGACMSPDSVPRSSLDSIRGDAKKPSNEHQGDLYQLLSSRLTLYVLLLIIFGLVAYMLRKQHLAARLKREKALESGAEEPRETSIVSAALTPVKSLFSGAVNFQQHAAAADRSQWQVRSLQQRPQRQFDEVAQFGGNAGRSYGGGAPQFSASQQYEAQFRNQQQQFSSQQQEPTPPHYQGGGGGRGVGGGDRSNTGYSSQTALDQYVTGSASAPVPSQPTTTPLSPEDEAAFQRYLGGEAAQKYMKAYEQEVAFQQHMALQRRF